MTRKEVEERLLPVLEGHLKANGTCGKKKEEWIKKGSGFLKPKTRFKEDLGMDSLDMIELLLQVEEEHGIILDETRFREFSKLDDAIKFFMANYELSKDDKFKQTAEYEAKIKKELEERKKNGGKLLGNTRPNDQWTSPKTPKKEYKKKAKAKNEGRNPKRDEKSGSKRAKKSAPSRPRKPSEGKPPNG